MKHPMRLIILMVIPILAGCATMPSAAPDYRPVIQAGDEEIADFCLFLPSRRRLLDCCLTGQVSRKDENPGNLTDFGCYLELEHVAVYQEEGLIVREKFYSVYGMLESLSIHYYGKVDKYIPVGKAGPSGPLADLYEGDFLLAVWSPHYSDYLIEKFRGEPVYYNGVYWYDPQKLIEISDFSVPF